VTGPTTIVSLVSMPEWVRHEIEALDPAVRLVEAPGWFDGELRDTWPAYTTATYIRPDSIGSGTRDERDDLLARADVIVAGFPVPLDLAARAPRLRWFHQLRAGASNLQPCDLWGSDVVVTTSRGLGNPLAIAEYVIAAFLHFARGLNQAGRDREQGSFERAAYEPALLAGKTVCVIGAGGIGREVGRLCSALGMRVVGTRRSPDRIRPEGFSELGAPEELLRLLGAASFVAVCCQWTPETEGLVGREALAAMPVGAVIVNVARGEIIDEDALRESLFAGRLRGVALDVYRGEFEHPPAPDLWADPRVLITPHVSSGSETAPNGPYQLFIENLEALLAGRDLRNVVDWSRGY
jgi:phosphoglycerate dehydrogenase-like enzyme